MKHSITRTLTSLLAILALATACACTSTPATQTTAAAESAGGPPAGFLPEGAGGPPGGAGGASSVNTDSISRKWLDVAYATDSATQKLDIYLPETGDGPFPVIVSLHGGGFMMGSKKSGELSPMLVGLTKGYAVVSVDYRMSGEAKFPAAIQDVKAAIRFIKANAKTYKLNSNKIATWGGSAGGHLSALIGTSAGDKYLEGTSGNLTVSSNVQAVVDWYGPIWFSTMDEEFKALGVTPKMGVTSAATSAESKYLGKTVGTTEGDALAKLASPQSYIDALDPPFYIQHGTVDTNIPITQSINFGTKLASAIGASKVTFEKIEGAAHGGSGFTADANVAKIFAFLDKYLK